MVKIPGITGGRKAQGFAIGKGTQLSRCGFAEDDESGLLHASHYAIVVGGNVAL
jgi:hypothetical protein